MSSTTYDVDPQSVQAKEIAVQNEVVRAGAGAGKTTNLIERITDYAIEFKQQNERWPRIVVTTFTRKATQELKERLLEKANHIGSEELSSYFSSQDIFISTIHGVLSLFLKNMSHKLDLDAQFKVVESGIAKFRSKQTAREIIFTNPVGSQLLESFSFEHLVELLAQYDALKSEVSGLRPIEISDLQECQKVAYADFSAQLRSAAELVLSRVEDEKWTTYASELKRYAELFVTEPLLPGAELLERLSLLGAKPRASKKIDIAASEALKAALDTVKKDLVKPYFDSESWPQTVKLFASFKELGDIYAEEFHHEKWLKGFLEMSDLELKTSELVETHPQLFTEFSQIWDFWLIDEFQDTSPLQEKILSALIGKRSSYIVGDPQQSIYLFRGADSQLFEQKQKQIESSGVFKLLSKNYRSRPELLLFFNDFFGKLSEQFTGMEPRETTTNQDICVARMTGFEEGEKVDREVNERRCIVAQIQELIQNGESLEQVCVLARKNSELKKIAQNLNEFGIPTYINSVGSFSERREIIDAVALLKFLVNPYDSENLMVLLRTPMCRVEDKLLSEWLQDSPKQAWTVIREKEHSSLSALRKAQAFAKENGLCVAFEKALIDLHYFDLTHYHDATGRRESNLWKLVSTLREKEKEPGFNPLVFCQQLQNRSVLGALEEGDAVAALEPNAVQLMTIHASKGLQFNHVFLPGFHKAPSLSSKRFQSSRMSLDKELSAFSFAVPLGDEGKMSSTLVDRKVVKEFAEKELKEHERLLYVALTRAKQSVFISWSGAAEKESWLEKSQWSFTEGLHKTDSYSYECRRDKEKHPQVMATGKRSKSGELKPYSSELPATENVSGKFSVSRLLSESQPQLDVPFEASSEKTTRKTTDTSALTFLLSSSSEGQQLHGLLEDYSYDMSQDLEVLIAKRLPKNKDKARKAMTYMLELNEPPMKALLETGRSEWGFQLGTKKGLMEGQVDHWGVDGDTVWVVDYKTGSEKYKQSAVQQLNLYSLVFRKMFPGKEIKLAVVYPYGQKSYIFDAEPEDQIRTQYKI